MGGCTILFVDDDRISARMARLYFENAGHRVEVACNGDEGLSKLQELRPDLVFLELALPGGDGLDMCRRIRELSDVPIIMISAKSTETDRVAALEAGADDFLAKPLSPKEMLARARAVLRRSQAPARPSRIIHCGDLAIDTVRQEVRAGGRTISLRPKEFRILELLASEPEVAIPRRRLLASVWGEDFVGDGRTLTVHIAWLRSKLCGSIVRLKSVRGIGYKLCINQNDAGP